MIVLKIFLQNITYTLGCISSHQYRSEKTTGILCLGTTLDSVDFF